MGYRWVQNQTETLDIQGRGWEFFKEIVCFATEKKLAYIELTIKGCSSFSEFFQLAHFPGNYKSLQRRNEHVLSMLTYFRKAVYLVLNVNFKITKTKGLTAA